MADAAGAQDPTAAQPAPTNQQAQLPAQFPDDTAPDLRCLLGRHAVPAQVAAMLGALEPPVLEARHLANFAGSATELNAAIFEPAGMNT